MRILVVEDDSLLAAGLTSLLARAGHAVDQVRSGSQADGALRATDYELLVLDIGLPDIDGHELARRLRARMGDASLIALTGYGQPIDRELSRKAGFDHHLVKPVEGAALAHVLGERRLASGGM